MENFSGPAQPFSAHALEVALNSLPVGVSWARTEDQAIIFTNRKFTEMFGYVARDFQDIDDWIDRGYPLESDRALARQRWGEYFQQPGSKESPVDPIEILVRSKTGELKTVIVSGIILPATGWALATFVDITERKQNEEALRRAERLALENQAIFTLLVAHSQEMMVLVSPSGTPSFVSPAVGRLTGYTAEEYLALPEWAFLHPEDREQAAVIVDQLKEGLLQQVFRYRALQKSGQYRWVEAAITGYLENGTDRLGGYVSLVRDITDQKLQTDHLTAENHQLTCIALRDELTGIANRRQFNEALRTESLRQTRSEKGFSLLWLDIDHFKQFNDIYGHLAGDECLKQIAQMVKHMLRRESDLFARYGGEEFVALLPATDAAGALTLSKSIVQAVVSLAIPHKGSPHDIVTVSIGASSCSPGEDLDVNVLLHTADAALYRAKAAGRCTFCAG
ncbi:MAG: sensor domain-containing diguanylate cyclase [Janthinobacterium lividum]